MSGVAAAALECRPTRRSGGPVVRASTQGRRPSATTGRLRRLEPSPVIDADGSGRSRPGLLVGAGASIAAGRTRGAAASPSSVAGDSATTILGRDGNPRLVQQLVEPQPSSDSPGPPAPSPRDRSDPQPRRSLRRIFIEDATPDESRNTCGDNPRDGANAGHQAGPQQTLDQRTLFHARGFKQIRAADRTSVEGRRR